MHTMLPEKEMEQTLRDNPKGKVGKSFRDLGSSKVCHIKLKAFI